MILFGNHYLTFITFFDYMLLHSATQIGAWSGVSCHSRIYIYASHCLRLLPAHAPTQRIGGAVQEHSASRYRYTDRVHRVSLDDARDRDARQALVQRDASALRARGGTGAVRGLRGACGGRRYMRWVSVLFGRWTLSRMLRASNTERFCQHALVSLSGRPHRG